MHKTKFGHNSDLAIININYIDVTCSRKNLLILGAVVLGISGGAYTLNHTKSCKAPLVYLYNKLNKKQDTPDVSESIVKKEIEVIDSNSFQESEIQTNEPSEQRLDCDETLDGNEASDCDETLGKMFNYNSTRELDDYHMPDKAEVIAEQENHEAQNPGIFGRLFRKFQ
tara:strand:+ start:10023 stop:10529 length:507 start_codon:yes stop_codon:yes gene_type:complete